MRPTLPRALIWMEPTARYGWASDYPWGRSEEEREREHEFMELWGTAGYAKVFGETEEFLRNPMPWEGVQHIAVQSRNACTPDVASRLADIWFEIDVRGVLEAVQTPTLLLVHADQEGGVAEAQYIAAHMPAAEVRAMPGKGWTADELPAWVDEIREFIGVARPHAAMDSVLSTVLFTDIVGSTQRQATLGDRAWKQILQRHHSLVRQALARWQGIENDTAGDGFYATFDGPVRAISCASEIASRVRNLGFTIRAGIHTGECELADGKTTGLAVSIGARIASIAGPSEILVSQTVRDLIAGSGLQLENAGEHELKGIPDRWRLYRVGEPIPGTRSATR